MNAQRLRRRAPEYSRARLSRRERVSPLCRLEQRNAAGRRLIRRIWWSTFVLLALGVCVGVVFLAFGIRSAVQAGWDLDRVADPSAYWAVPLWLDLVAALIAFCSFSIGSSIALFRHLRSYPPSEKAFAEHLAARDAA